MIPAKRVHDALVASHCRAFYRAVRLRPYKLDRPMRTPVECCKAHAEAFGLFVAGDYARWAARLVPLA